MGLNAAWKQPWVDVRCLKLEIFTFSLLEVSAHTFLSCVLWLVAAVPTIGAPWVTI